jgi:hypothetical protein
VLTNVWSAAPKKDSIASKSFSGSTGFARCRSTPASLLRDRSCSWAQPLIAIIGMRTAHSCRRSSRATSPVPHGVAPSVTQIGRVATPSSKSDFARKRNVQLESRDGQGHLGKDANQLARWPREIQTGESARSFGRCLAFTVSRFAYRYLMSR